MHTHDHRADARLPESVAARLAALGQMGGAVRAKYPMTWHLSADYRAIIAAIDAVTAEARVYFPQLYRRGV